MRSTITSIWLILGLVGTALIVADENPGLLKARILQLESQVQALATENATLRAQLLQAVKSRMDEATIKQRALVEQEAGCVIDWAAAPPECASAK